MSEAVASLVDAANHLLVARYIATCMGALAIYDYLLTIDDEASYVWGGKKSWISYLFFANRYLLLFCGIISQIANEQSQNAQCIRNILIGSVLALFFLISSDVFILIRVYAVAGQNKLVALYLASLVCAKTIVISINISQIRVNAIPLPDVPIAAFKTCTASRPFHLQVSPQTISVVFDFSAFGTIIFFACSGVASIRFSSILRTIVADATVYFIMTMSLHILVLLVLTLANTTMNQFPLILSLILTPILINRAVLSLKKAADVSGGINRAWGMRHFSTIRFEPGAMSVSSASVISRLPDDPLETRLYTNSHSDVPLDELVQRAGP